MADHRFPFTSAPPNSQAGDLDWQTGDYRGAGRGDEQYLHHQAVGDNRYQQPRGFPYHGALPARDVLQQQGGGRGGGGWLPDGVHGALPARDALHQQEGGRVREGGQS